MQQTKYNGYMAEMDKGLETFSKGVNNLDITLEDIKKDMQG